MKKVEWQFKNQGTILVGGFCLLLVGLVLWMFPSGVNRFTFIMPIFAGFILYLIFSSLDKPD